MPEEIETKPEEIVEGQPKTEFIEKLKVNKFKILGGILGVLVFAGAVFGAYKLGQRQAQPVPQPTPTPAAVATPTPDPTANWKTYTNTKYGYSIKYPEEWFIEEKDVLIKLYNQDPNIHKFEKTREISTGVFDYPKEDFIFDINIIENILPKPALIQKSSIKIGGISGTKGILTGGEGEKILMGYMVKNGRTYTFYGRPADSTQKDYFDLILSTFRFLPQESLEMTPTPTPSSSVRRISYRNIPGWPVYKALLDFEFQFPPDYSFPQKNLVDFMHRGEFYCSFSTTKRVGTGLDYLNFIAIPKNYEDKIDRALKILNAPGYLKKEDVEIYSYSAIFLDLDQHYKHYQSDRALIVETDSMLLIVHYQQNETNQNWNYILESLKFGPNFNKDYFEENLNECRTTT